MTYSFIRLLFLTFIICCTGVASAQCTFGIFAEVGDASACSVSDGTIDIGPTSGTPPFTYLWSNSATVPNLAGLAAGVYTVVVTDAVGCIKRDTFTIAAPPSVTLSLLQPVTCFGAANGSLKASGFCGLRNSGGRYYQYRWYKINGAAGALLPAQTDSLATGLDTGTYYVVIRDANNDTARSATMALTQPSRIVPAATVTAATCFGASGSVTLSATGGTGPYTYAQGAGSYVSGGTFGGLAAGIYTFHIKDVTGCVQDTVLTVSQPARIIPAAVVGNVVCNGGASGTVSLSASGGTGAFNYALGSGAYGSSGSFSGLSAGGYTFHVRDAAGCVRDTVITLTEPARIVPAAAVANVACFGEAAGSVTLSATGGTGPYTYAQGTGTYMAGGTFSGLAAGTYTFHVKDAAGCVRDTTLTISQASRIVPAAVINAISCNGAADGSVTLSAAGGAGAFSYAMGNGAYTASGTFGGLSAGTYTFHIRDAASCIRDTAILLTQPAPLTLSLSATPVSCYRGSDGSVMSTVAGGTQPYSYAWSNGASTAALSGVPAASYSLNVTDANGCAAGSAAVVSSPDSIRLPAITTAPSCFGFCDGSIALNPAGGIAPYTYTWSTGAATKDLSDLCAGSYTLTLTDANGCIAARDYTLANPAAVTVNAGPDRDLCQTGTITLRALSSAPAAAFQWSGSNGAGADSSVLIVSAPGVYYVLASAGACQGRDTVVIGQVADDFNAEFLASTQAFRDSVYSIINISSPEPDTVLWSLPATPAVLEISRSKYLAELIFRDTGVYVITMTGRKGQCEKVMENRVVVIEGQGYAPVSGSPKRAHIKAFNIAPNPSSGRFNVHIELEEEGPVRLRLLALSSSGAADDRQDSGKKLYDFNYDLSLRSGQYLLLLETGRGSQNLKLTVQ